MGWSWSLLATQLLGILMLLTYPSTNVGCNPMLCQLCRRDVQPPPWFFRVCFLTGVISMIQWKAWPTPGGMMMKLGCFMGWIDLGGGGAFEALSSLRISSSSPVGPFLWMCDMSPNYLIFMEHVFPALLCFYFLIPLQMLPAFGSNSLESK